MRLLFVVLSIFGSASQTYPPPPFPTPFPLPLPPSFIRPPPPPPPPKDDFWSLQNLLIVISGGSVIGLTTLGTVLRKQFPIVGEVVDNILTVFGRKIPEKAKDGKAKDGKDKKKGKEDVTKDGKGDNKKRGGGSHLVGIDGKEIDDNKSITNNRWKGYFSLSVGLFLFVSVPFTILILTRSRNDGVQSSQPPSYPSPLPTPPLSPPVGPPVSPLPSLPEATMICVDNCVTYSGLSLTNNSICEDGGVYQTNSSQPRSCYPGTDCTDCGSIPTPNVGLFTKRKIIAVQDISLPFDQHISL